MTGPTLVVLAAGRSTRYGAAKQLEIVGPAGAMLIDYAIHDARRAGFARVVLIVRPDLERAIRESVGVRWSARVALAYAMQDRPLGTAHAVLAARSVLDGPFAVINGDDFYGAASFQAIGDCLREMDAAPTYALVTFALRDTLPENGTVNRAIVDASPEGWVVDVREAVGIERAGRDARFVDDRGRHPLAGDTPVSMNMWGFTPAVFLQLETAFEDFRARGARGTPAEFLLPNVVGDLVRRRAARVRAIPARGRWRGLTRRSDLPAVRSLIEELTAAGEYPARFD